MKILLLTSLLSTLLMLSCKKDNDTRPKATVYKASGDISQKLQEFKNSLGALNTTTGQVTGRREINWESVPDTLLDKPLPKDFFNPIGSGAAVARQRGIIIGDGASEVSATQFSRINQVASSEFHAFSGDNTYAAVSQLEWPVGFEVAGLSTPAEVSAFGMVFSDVDVEGSVTLEFFDNDVSLGKFSPPVHDASSSFSFLGVQFEKSIVSKIIVRHEGILSAGQKDISQGGTKDLVVFDDIIFSEPLKQ